MLKGNLNCKDINKLLLGYIRFELPKKEMSKVALHLRNCPLCMEKYTKIQRRKKELQEKMLIIEKELRMQSELSCYIDNEASEDIVFIVEGMLLSDKKYKNEIIEYEKIRNYLIFLKEEIKNNYTENNATKIIAKLKHKKENPITKLVFQPFRYLFHELLRFQ